MRLYPMLLIPILALLPACKPTQTQKKDDGPKGGASPAPGPGTGGTDSTGGTDGTGGTGPEDGTGGTEDGILEDIAYYGGYDGQAAFSFFVGYDVVTLDDPTIARLEPITLVLEAAKLEAAIAAAKAKDPKFNEAKARKFCPASAKVVRVTPLKTGKTKLHGIWDGSEPSNSDFTVYPYTPAQIAQGKARYLAAETAGTKRGCISCHGSGASGAPVHELGYAAQYSDEQWAGWVTTGKLLGSTARIPHSWTFASEDEKKATIAYVRSLQSKDVGSFAQAYFEDCLAYSSDFEEIIKTSPNK